MRRRPLDHHAASDASAMCNPGRLDHRVAVIGCAVLTAMLVVLGLAIARRSAQSGDASNAAMA
jgi:hypothetical protein